MVTPSGFTSYPLSKRQWNQHSLDQALNNPHQEEGEDNATNLDNALND